MSTITVARDKELDLAAYTIEGELTYAELKAAIRQYYEGPLTKYTLWDFSGSDVNKITTDDVRNFGVQVREAGKARAGGTDLIVVAGLLKFGLARMYSAYTSLTSAEADPLTTMVFRTKDDALAWLTWKRAEEKNVQP
jgi:hypothetical protein